MLFFSLIASIVICDGWFFPSSVVVISLPAASFLVLRRQRSPRCCRQFLRGIIVELIVRTV